MSQVPDVAAHRGLAGSGALGDLAGGEPFPAKADVLGPLLFARHASAP